MGRIHPVFHASLLEPYRASTWAERLQEPAPPVEVEGELEYEVREILDSKMERRQLFYLVDWVGDGPEERTWEAATNVGHTKEAVADFHRADPCRPSLRDIPPRCRRPHAPSIASSGASALRGPPVTNHTAEPRNPVIVCRLVRFRAQGLLKPRGRAVVFFISQGHFNSSCSYPQPVVRS